jgi:ribosomal protein S18 acetylase RimI-like enzyme
VTVLVRAATPEQYERIGELTAAAFIAGGTASDAGYVAVLRDVAGRAEHGEVLVAVDEPTGGVLGAVAFVVAGSPLADLCREGEAEFRMLAVDPAVQGAGAGAALVHACLDRARALGSTAIVISTAERSAAARHLYERIGFTRLPERDRELERGPRLIAYRIELSRPDGTKA